MEFYEKIVHYLPYNLNVEVSTLKDRNNYIGILTGVGFTNPDAYFLDGVHWNVVKDDVDDFPMPNGTHQIIPILKDFSEIPKDFELINKLISIQEMGSNDYIIEQVKCDVVDVENNKIFGIKYTNSEATNKEITLSTALGLCCLINERRKKPYVAGPQWEMWSELFKRHYDVFNLIDEGKAYATNTN